jgi:hypothetical protein
MKILAQTTCNCQVSEIGASEQSIAVHEGHALRLVLADDVFLAYLSYSVKYVASLTGLWIGFSRCFSSHVTSILIGS